MNFSLRCFSSRESTNNELIADVNPTFNWVRLAQRVPVRIHLDEVPDGVLLAAGMTCTVIVKPVQEQRHGYSALQRSPPLKAQSPINGLLNEHQSNEEL